MTCNKCGSEDSVSKAEAWDALQTIPSSKATHIHQLEDIASAAWDLILSPVGDGAVTRSVNANSLEALIEKAAKVFQ